MKFSTWAAAALAALAVLISGCGDTFRPVATPLPQPSPDPQTQRFAVVTACVVVAGDCQRSATGASGVSTDIDVSGDSVMGITTVGRSPVNALAETTLVATADRDSDTISTYSHFTLSTVTTVTGVTTTGLPSGAAPTALVTANGTIYVAESGRGVIGVLGGAPFAITAEVPVGTNPVSLTVLPNGRKLYAVNSGSNSVTVIDTTDNSVVTTVPVGGTPVFAVPSADSSHVYVVNQSSGTVSVIDATTDAVAATITVGSSPNYAVFDIHNQRVVVTNPGSGTISVIVADPTSPLFLKPTGVTNVTVGSNPRSVTALPDGTKLYVANAGSNSVSVVNSLSLAVSKTIPVGTFPISISSDAESTKVLTANRDSNDISTINTATDSEVADASGKVVRILEPQIDPTCVSTASAPCARFNPVFVSVGPG
ncbi:MAG: beta-propeller fold lactonase family protein [Acidobacteria bacterium]|nr:beta-propeller fold lactonase family protein [Acidobacteriota bacterium]MBV9148041.1 beta-propeller fold lactonase family protein [Acidobacteriota bacterium]